MTIVELSFEIVDGVLSPSAHRHIAILVLILRLFVIILISSPETDRDLNCQRLGGGMLVNNVNHLRTASFVYLVSGNSVSKV